MLLNLPRRSGGGVSLPFPYTFPILSTKATTGSASDWTHVAGNMTQKDASERWVLSTTNDRAYHYQDFSIGATREAVVDAGNARLDMSHKIDTWTDQDDAIVVAEFFDGSSNWLGRVHNTPQDNSEVLVLGVTDAVVPPGTRTIRFAWQACRQSGTEISAYVQDFTATIKEETVNTWDDVVVMYALSSADLTGFTQTTNTVNVETYSTANDWEWQSAAAFTGGNFSSSACELQGMTIPSGWLAKIAAGNVRAHLRCSFHNANGGDDCGIGLRLNNGSTNPEVHTGRIQIKREIQQRVEDFAIPSDTTSIDLMLNFYRSEGTYSDGAIEKISLLLYEPTT